MFENYLMRLQTIDLWQLMYSASAYVIQKNQTTKIKVRKKRWVTCSLAIARMRVDLPQPLGPHRPYSLPRFRCSFVLFSRILAPYARLNSQSHRSSPVSAVCNVKSPQC